MLRIAWINKPIELIAFGPSIRTFTTTSVVQGIKAKRFLKAQKKRQKNEARQIEIKSSNENVDPVLGRQNTPFINRIQAELKAPRVLSMGYDHSEVDKLLASLVPAKAKHYSTLSEDLITSSSTSSNSTLSSEKQEAIQREAILRILNIRNSNNADSVKLALKLTVEEFQRFPGDTGSSEVQAACMTIKIQNMVDHIKANHKDFANIRKLRILVQKRQSILRYLKRDNPERYFWAIQKLGLTDSVIMKEFNMDRQYMQDFKLYGDKILVKPSKRKVALLHKERMKQKSQEKADAAKEA